MTNSRKILERFISDCGGIGYAADKIKAEVEGELEEFTFLGAKGYAAYGNREFIVYLDDEEESEVFFLDFYNGNPVIVNG